VKNTVIHQCFQVKTALKTGLIFLLMLFSGSALAADQTIGDVAANIYGTFSNLTQLITACSYIAGLGFAIGAIMKFKQHKDNPTQIPIGTPVALVFIAAALLFLPSILGVTGATVFGGGDAAQVAGPTGVIFS